MVAIYTAECLGLCFVIHELNFYMLSVSKAASAVEADGDDCVYSYIHTSVEFCEVCVCACIFKLNALPSFTSVNQRCSYSDILLQGCWRQTDTKQN